MQETFYTEAEGRQRTSLARGRRSTQQQMTQRVSSEQGQEKPAPSFELREERPPVNQGAIETPPLAPRGEQIWLLHGGRIRRVLGVIM